MAGLCEVGSEPPGSLKAKRGIRCRRAVRREHLTMDHAVDRVAYATLRQNFDWRNFIFSDEVIVSSSNDGPALVYRMDGHRYDERFVGRLNRLGRVSVACWGWMSYNGAGLLERIHGRFTAEVYEHILANVMIPSARERYSEGTRYFQQDNHPYTPLTGSKDGLRGVLMST
ncbi:hypothetical protein ANN_24365 [Periplaneta americana]|uniref:Uncharacterized protein n=1 Tax=Periplaneta americana TaxID=6978 RepID=A0ABQ8S3A3_PERAM|nr:hypothetical protein ANN_24365 [Periplaneta americana]